MKQSEIEQLADELLLTLRHDLNLPDEIIMEAELGTPLPVTDIEGDPSYWLVPIQTEKYLLGYIRLGLGGKLLAYGKYGQGAKIHEFPPLAYISKDAADYAIKSTFGSKYRDIPESQLVHDGPPERIAWLARGTTKNRQTALLFWSFGTTYVRPISENHDRSSG